MKIITTHKTIYCFKELPDAIQEKAITNLYDINVDHDWWECTYEDAEMVGLKISSFDIDRGSYCKLDFIESAEASAHLIIDNHGVDCENYKTAKSYLKERDELINTADKDENGNFKDEYQLDSDLDDLDSEFKKSISENYLIMLQKDYKYLTSEEAIKECIESNDYEFDINGKLA